VAALAFHNFRQRKSEIGLMRAIGLGSMSILGAFLGKAMIVGIFGGMLGMAIGIAIIEVRVLNMNPSISLTDTWSSASLTWTALWIPILMVLLTVLASWLAAYNAIRQDAAIVLQGE
jgi:putative ABC transport system permease protein